MRRSIYIFIFVVLLLFTFLTPTTFAFMDLELRLGFFELILWAYISTFPISGPVSLVLFVWFIIKIAKMGSEFVYKDKNKKS